MKSQLWPWWPYSRDRGRGRASDAYPLSPGLADVEECRAILGNPSWRDSFDVWAALVKEPE